MILSGEQWLDTAGTRDLLSHLRLPETTGRLLPRRKPESPGTEEYVTSCVSEEEDACLQTVSEGKAALSTEAFPHRSRTSNYRIFTMRVSGGQLRIPALGRLSLVLIDPLRQKHSNKLGVIKSHQV